MNRLVILRQNLLGIFWPKHRNIRDTCNLRIEWSKLNRSLERNGKVQVTRCEMSSITRNRFYIFGALIFTLFSVPLVFYKSVRQHLEEVECYEIRLFDNQSIISKLYHAILRDKFKEHILGPKHPLHKRVTGVVAKLKEGNKELETFNHEKLSIQVVDRDVIDIFMLPSGDLFISTGMIETCNNDDTLAFIIGHEMAHIILKHHERRYQSRTSNDDWLKQLELSREMELEADVLGLKLAAKSCYDIREAPAYWKKIQMIIEEQRKIGPDQYLIHTYGSGDVPEHLSTHPTPIHRYEHLKEHLSDAMMIRSNCGCKKLKGQEPNPALQYKNYMKNRNLRSPNLGIKS